MSHLLVVSPHLDDGCLGLGQMLANHPDVTVATVFTAIPHGGFCTGYDADSGFSSSRQAMRLRRAEDTAAMLVLDVRQAWLGLLDAAYRDADLHVNVVAQAIEEAVGEDTRQLCGPVGIRHPDHILVGAACRMVARERGLECFVYEELPYRVEWPEDVCAALAMIRGQGFHVERDFLGDGPMERKEEAVRCYASQLPWLNERHLYVAERVHRLTPCG